LAGDQHHRGEGDEEDCGSHHTFVEGSRWRVA
jgi:hypothetical protein